MAIGFVPNIDGSGQIGTSSQRWDTAFFKNRVNCRGQTVNLKYFVSDTPTRFAFSGYTTDTRPENGDVVFQYSPSGYYLVVDNTNLGSEAGYYRLAASGEMALKLNVSGDVANNLTISGASVLLQPTANGSGFQVYNIAATGTVFYTSGLSFRTSGNLYLDNLATGKVVVIGSGGYIQTGSASLNDLNNITGLRSNIQQQLDALNLTGNMQPGGGDKSIQYNNTGVTAGNFAFKFDKTVTGFGLYSPSAIRGYFDLNFQIYSFPTISTLQVTGSGVGPYSGVNVGYQVYPYTVISGTKYYATTTSGTTGVFISSGGSFNVLVQWNAIAGASGYRVIGSNSSTVVYETAGTGFIDSGVSNASGTMLPYFGPNFYVDSLSNFYASGKMFLNSQPILTTGNTGTFLDTTVAFNTYYPRNNPSGFMTTGGTGAFLTTGAGDARYALASNTGAFLTTGAGDGRYALAAHTGAFTTTGYVTGFVFSGYYPRNNPSGYVMTSQTGAFQDSGTAFSTYYPRTNPSGYVMTSQTGAFLNSGTAATLYYPNSNPNGYISNIWTSLSGGAIYIGPNKLVDVNNRNFYDNTNTPVIDLNGKWLKSTLIPGSGTSVDWNKCQLYMSTISGNSTLSLDWTGHILTGGWIADSLTVGGSNVVTANQTGNFVDLGSAQTINGTKSFSTISIGGTVKNPNNSFGLDYTSYLSSGHISGTWTADSLYVGTSPVVTAGQTGAFLTTGAGDARYVDIISGQRTLPTDISGAIDIGNFTIVNGAHNIEVFLTCSAAGFSTAKTYNLSVPWNFTATNWNEVIPLTDTGPFQGNNFALDMNANANVLSLRIRRNSGNVAGNVFFTLLNQGWNTDVFASSSSSGFVAVPTTQTSWDALQSVYYPRTNPSGYIMTSQTGAYLDSGSAFNTYYPRTNPSGYVMTGQTGNLVDQFTIQIISGQKTFKKLLVSGNTTLGTQWVNRGSLGEGLYDDMTFMNAASMVDGFGAIGGMADWLYLCNLKPNFYISTNTVGADPTPLFNNNMNSNLITPLTGLPFVLTVTGTALGGWCSTDVSRVFMVPHRYAQGSILTDWRFEIYDGSNWQMVVARSGVSDMGNNIMSFSAWTGLGTSYSAIYGIRLTVNGATGPAWNTGNLVICKLQLRDFRPIFGAAQGIGALDIAGGSIYGSLSVNGPMTVTGQLTNTVPSGTPPFVVSSPTRVTNLNADLLDGYQASNFVSGAAGSNGQFQFNRNGAIGASVNLYNDTGTNYVGYGIANPSSPFHVNCYVNNSSIWGLRSQLNVGTTGDIPYPGANMVVSFTNLNYNSLYYHYADTGVGYSTAGSMVDASFTNSSTGTGVIDTASAFLARGGIYPDANVKVNAFAYYDTLRVYGNWGSFGNLYGLRIRQMAPPGTGIKYNASYGISQEYSGDRNIFAGRTFFGTNNTQPTAQVHFGAGVSTASGAFLKFTSGALLSSPENGAVEYDGTNLYFTDNTTTRFSISTQNALGVANPYSTLTTGNYGANTGLITINFSGKENQRFNLSGSGQNYIFSGQNWPGNGNVNDVYINIINTASGTIGLTFPSGWCNLGAGWPTGIISGKYAMVWLRAYDTTGVMGTYNVAL